ncbi:MAG: UTP--glucose-1-phosphate uridylyltransferase GalU [Acidimicrobiia bacterium]
MTSTVRKAVIPSAGNATRFLPATKAQPKAMLALVDKPAIQYVVEEAVAAGITEILVITGRGTQSVVDHFDRAPELERELEATGKLEALAHVRSSSDLASLHYLRQGRALGLGHAVLMGRAFVGDEPFAVLLPDELMVDDATLLKRMITAYDDHGGSVVAFREVPREEVSSYGVAAVGAHAVEADLLPLLGVVEKPSVEDAPSNFIATGRYVFSPAVFDCLEKVAPGRGGEIQLTDGMALLIEREPVFAAVFEHGRHDVGTPLDFLQAAVTLAADRPDLGPAFLAFLADFMRQRGLGS